MKKQVFLDVKSKKHLKKLAEEYNKFDHLYVLVF